MRDPQTGVAITLAFDDTPGHEDTTYADRARNAVLMHRYSRIHFPEPQENAAEITDTGSPTKPELRRRKYPNAILLVAKWESIKEDAHNDPEHFTSSIGKTMLNLSISNLVDFERTNVIVVVTRSMSSWDDYEDDNNEEEKNKHWSVDARKKTLMVEALQRKLFPGSRLWRVVFIENGGGQSVKKHRTLPNGELSHQNLFDAVRRLFDSVDDKTMPKDLVGIHALRLLTGAESLRPHFEQRRVEVLCRMELSEIISEQEKASIVSNLRNCTIRFLTHALIRALGQMTSFRFRHPLHLLHPSPSNFLRLLTTFWGSLTILSLVPMDAHAFWS
jgi:hypothetical protein